jgi:hypothetical protein
MKKKTNVRGVKPIKPIPDPPPLDQLQGIAKLAATEIAKECACLFAQQGKVVAIIVKHMRPVMDRLGLALVETMEPPRHSCHQYFITQRCEHPELIARQKFDKMVDAEEFTDGPFCETFGSGYGEPYNPRRQAFGMAGKRGVYCELSEKTSP